MLRLGMLFWMAAAIGVGLLLYNVKHEVQGLEQQLARTNRAIETTHERIHVLHAEWSLLNDPERLRALSERHLDIVPMRPAQFVGATAIAALPVASPRADTALAAAEPATAAQPVASRSPAATARAGAPADARQETRQGEPPARLAPQREEPMAPPRQAPPPSRRELEAGAPRPLMPGAPMPGTAGTPPRPPVVAVSAAPPPPPPARAPAASSLGAPAVALPPPVPFSRPQGGN